MLFSKKNKDIIKIILFILIICLLIYILLLNYPKITEGRRRIKNTAKKAKKGAEKGAEKGVDTVGGAVGAFPYLLHL